MITLHFSALLQATPEKVWDCLWDADKYKIWTSTFCEGSYYKADNFIKGSNIHFLSPDGGGMYSIIESIDEHKHIEFRHLGELKNFEERPVDEAAKDWVNAKERYTLIATGDQTELHVAADTLEAHQAFMQKGFTLALQKLKEMTEE